MLTVRVSMSSWAADTLDCHYFDIISRTALHVGWDEERSLFGMAYRLFLANPTFFFYLQSSGLGCRIVFNLITCLVQPLPPSPCIKVRGM